MTAAEHARRASELLRLVERQEAELEELLQTDPERHLELIANGVVRRLNASRQWSAELASAHALAAIALTIQPAIVEALVGAGDRADGFQ
jgi:ubiquinone biosynthesis protein COQ9